MKRFPGEVLMSRRERRRMARELNIQVGELTEDEKRERWSPPVTVTLRPARHPNGYYAKTWPQNLINFMRYQRMRNRMVPRERNVKLRRAHAPTPAPQLKIEAAKPSRFSLKGLLDFVLGRGDPIKPPPGKPPIQYDEVLSGGRMVLREKRIIDTRPLKEQRRSGYKPPQPEPEPEKKS